MKRLDVSPFKACRRAISQVLSPKFQLRIRSPPCVTIQLPSIWKHAILLHGTQIKAGGDPLENALGRSLGFMIGLMSGQVSSPDPAHIVPTYKE